MRKSTTILILLFAYCMDILAYAFEKDNIYYTITSSANKEVEVTYKTSDVTTDTYVGVVTIPESVTYDNATYKVTGIGRKAFYQEDKLEKVSLPSTIKTIAAGAFLGCDNLIEVSSRGSSGIETLKSSAFARCPSLQSVPDFSNISNLPNDVFYQCGKLEKVIFSSKLTAVDKYSFNGCYSLQSAGDLSNVKSVGDYSFGGCEILEFNPTDFSQITSVGRGSFAACTKLESIDLSNATIKSQNKESSAFAGCTSLKTVTFPKTATEIPAYIFNGCINLETVVFNEATKITFIGNSAFGNCHKLKTFPNISAVTSIGSGAFTQCYSLEIERLTIPDVTTFLGAQAFMGCPGIRHISIGNGITEIRQRTFANKTGTGNEVAAEEYNLETIAFGNNIKAIQEGAFEYCTKIKEVTLPQSVETFGNYIFNGCKSLTFADLSETQIKKMPKYAFSGTPFNAIFQSQKSQQGREFGYSRIRESENKNTLILPPTIEIIEDYAFSKCINLQEVSLDSSITEIGSKCFEGCDNITSFTIEKSKIKEIKDYAFSGMSKLTTFKIPSTVERIGRWAFSDCRSLTSINIPNSVVSIGSDAFRYCSGLTSVTIPNSVKSIGNSAFSGCDGLTAVHISNLESWCNIVFANGSGNPLDYAKHLYLNGEEITELTIPGNIKSIGDYQFYNCVGMTSIIMHDSIKTIGEGAFSDCDGLTEINLPDSLTIIGEDAFSSCNNLRTISLPKNITSIGKDAFAWNYDIESVYSFAETPVACEENIFTSSTYNDATLYIPHGTEVAYSQTSPWNKFKIKSISTSVENVVPDNQTSDKVCIYTIDGKLFKKGFDFIKEAKGLPSNVYIINGKKVYVK